MTDDQQPDIQSALADFAFADKIDWHRLEKILFDAGLIDSQICAATVQSENGLFVVVECQSADVVVFPIYSTIVVDN